MSWEGNAATDIVYFHRQQCLEYVRAPMKITTEEEELTTRMLEALADHIRFRIASDGEHACMKNNKKSKAADHSTRRQESKAAKQCKKDEGCRLGFTWLIAQDFEMIALTRSFVMKLVGYTEAGNCQSQIWATVHTAKILVHELAHAKTLLSHGQKGQYFFPHASAAEDGCDWKSRLWGGILGLKTDLDKPTAKNNIVLEPWPSQQRAAYYVRREMHLGLRLFETR